jgi:hypothetical protein
VRRGLPRLERHGAAAVAVVAVSLVAGCGDSGKSGTTGSTAAGTTPTWTATVANNLSAAPHGDEVLIDQALKAVFVSGDPVAACETYATPAYVVTAYGDLSGCKAAQTSGGTAKSFSATGVVPNGSTASPTVTVSGGPVSGEKIHVTMVKDGDIWKVDSAKANVPVGP